MMSAHKPSQSDGIAQIRQVLDNVSQLLDQLDAVLYVSDMDTHEVLFMNDYGKQLFQREDSIIGKPCYAVIQGRQIPCEFCTNSLLREPGIKKPYVWEFFNQLTQRWVKCVDNCITWADGRQVRLEIALNIDDNKALQREISNYQVHMARLVQERTGELRESQNRYEALLKSLPVGLFQASPEGFCVYMNKETCSMLGLTWAELLGPQWAEALHPEDREAVVQTWLQCGREQAPFNMEYRFVRPDGRVVWTIAQATPYLGHDQKLWYVGTLTDITERKEMELEMARLDRLNLIGQMAAGIGHEIRNPMTSVRGFLQLLRGKEDLQPYLSYFDMMIEELDRANLIITEYLSLARKDAADLENHNLNQILEAIYPLILSDAANCSVTVTFAKEPLPDLPLNPKEIRQLVLNLVRNGLDAMTGGGVLSLRTSLEGEDVILAVQDQGSGIDPSLLDKLGTPFMTTKDQGVGLGLATCYSIVARHGAKLDVQTGPQGTTFFVRFLGGKG